jgi:CheY-like chemotaxis protein
MMSIELLKRDSGDEQSRSKILDIVLASSHRATNLVRQILSFARGLGGARVVIRLRYLIDDLEGIISETFPRDIRIVTDVPKDLWPIMGDPTQLNQVLLNLAINARDAMPHGGTLTLSAVNMAVDSQDVGTSPDAKSGPQVLLQVTDTGLGIPPEVRERIFEPFFTTKEVGKGTGLGLSTVLTIVKGHHGTLTVESEVGRGTTFKIHLPADPALRIDTPVPPLADPSRGRDELVLVVDDEFYIRQVTQQTLETFGYRVITASNGAEAVALYAKHGKDVAVVLTDTMMPVMNGVVLDQALIRLNPSVRVIATSGFTSPENVAEAGNAGAKDFLAKPYTAQALLQLVREVLDRPASLAAR